MTCGRPHKGEFVLERNRHLFWALFRSTFLISAFTFGGGYVIIPLMRKRFVEELGWISEQEMLDMIAIAQSSPGPIAVNASILIGYRLAGIAGAFCTILGTVLPPLAIITAVSVFYEAFRSSRIAGALMLGMQAGVAAVILDVVLNMAAGVVKLRKALPILVMLGAFAAVRSLQICAPRIILTCGAIGAAVAWRRQKLGGEQPE